MVPDSSAVALSTSSTRIRHARSRRLAKDLVKLAGICCAITIGAFRFAGNAGRISSNVRGPPVLTPISTTLSFTPVALPALLWLCGALGVGRAGAGLLANALLEEVDDGRIFALVTVRTLRIRSAATSSSDMEIVPPGFATKSTAPRFSASKVAKAPFCVSDDSIMTGTGRSAIISDSAEIPSISGMLISSVTTSGLNSRFIATASLPLRA